uniref:PGG domain-containing protein n=1 Tax=Salix viminalis TaxID=40686 RepID=A0A6N2L286_SALVM
MEEMQRKLQEAAAEGNVTSLLALLQEDKLVLDRCGVTCPAETPLHIAAMLGHLRFTREILCRKPEWVGELDLRRSSPLQLATANGHLEVVKALLMVDADICLVKDRNGWNPLHVAVIKGRIDVLKELVQAKPDAIRTRGQRGETILHLCVKHCQLEALKFLVGIAIADTEFVNSEDDDGFTILHLAVADREIEALNYLISESPVQVNALNANGFTALDIVLAQGRRNIKDAEIQNTLREAGAISSKVMSSTMHGSDAIRPHKSTSTLKKRKSWRKKNWLEERRNTLMVVASLIATMAFQAGISPPIGNWQEDKQESLSGSHEAGRSIMADKMPKEFAFFVGYNTTSFLASISVIILLISGIPFKWRFFMWVLMIIMWIAIIATARTYIISISCLSSRRGERSSAEAGFGVAFYAVAGIVFTGHSTRLIRKLVTLARRSRARRFSRSPAISQANI